MGETLALANDDLVLFHTNWQPQTYDAVQEEEKVDNDDVIDNDKDEVKDEESKEGSAAAQQN